MALENRFRHDKVVASRLERHEEVGARARYEKDVSCRPFYRSCDFVAPSQSNGCAMAYSYCYVARRKGNANPITTFVNIEEIVGSMERHAAKQ